MDDFAVSGNDLKKMLQHARNQPVAFAFNAGKSEAEHYLGMDRKRPPDVIAKVAKKEGPSAKVAFGHASVDGTCLNLTCEAPLPNMARILKKYLNYNKISMSVQILDARGQVEDADLDEVQTDTPEPKETEAATVADADAPVADDGQDPKAIAAQLQSDKARMTALSGDALTLARRLVQAAVTVLKSRDIDQAATLAQQLTDVIDTTLAAPAPLDTSEDELLSLRKKLDALRQQVGTIS